MAYWLGFDGGGTKTDCVILNAAEEIVSKGRGGPANALRAGFDAAFVSLGQRGPEALRAANLQPGDVTGVCAGLAGAAQRSVTRRMIVFLTHEFYACGGEGHHGL